MWWFRDKLSCRQVGEAGGKQSRVTSLRTEQHEQHGTSVA